MFLTMMQQGLFALLVVWALSGVGAEVPLVQVDSAEQAVFGGAPSRIGTIFRNRSEKSIKLALSSRVYQVSASTLAPIEEKKPFRTISIQGGEAVIETIEVTFPEVRTETRFILQWDSEEKKLGRTMIHVFP